MPFFQAPPELTNAYETDLFLQHLLKLRLPSDALQAAIPSLREMGDLSAGSAYQSLLHSRNDEPTLTTWDAWGNRVDRIEHTAHWREMAKVAAESGLVALAYERPYGSVSRVVQMSLVYLFEPSSGVYSCPLAMTDGAAHALAASGNRTLLDRALPRLTSRDPSRMWTSGQWMTERTGGSDVGLSETIAKREGDAWRLYGTKWFTSATTSEMALTLARPEGNPPGGAGLALFYLETRDDRGTPNQIEIHRLKEKLGTRMVPTAEITLTGSLATPVMGLRDGTKSIATMLKITRTWNSIAAAAGMRRAVELTKAYSKKRIAFGAPLSEKPLHIDTTAVLIAETMAALTLSLRGAELVGKEECGDASEQERALLRLLTPIAKLVTGKQAVSVASEALECFGGAGYVEDTGLPQLLRDAQVLPIWEGTTNVLSLDVLRALGRDGTLTPVGNEFERAVARAPREGADVVAAARRAIVHAQEWLALGRRSAPAMLEEGARRFSWTLGRVLQVALLLESSAHGFLPALSAARFLARGGIDAIDDASLADDARRLFHEA